MSTSSILTQGQRRLLLVILVAAGFMLANSLFLVAFRGLEETERFRLAPGTLPVFYQLMILSHTWVGMVVFPVLIGFVGWHLVNALKCRTRPTLFSGLTLITAAIALVVTGLFILTEANSKENRYIYWAHMSLGGVIPVLYAVHRVVSYNRPTVRALRVGFASIASLCGVFLALHIVTLPKPINTQREAAVVSTQLDNRLVSVSLEQDPFVPFVPAGFVPMERPFFPAASTTTTGRYMPSRILTLGDNSTPERIAAEYDRHGFVHEEKIGAATCVRCHPDIVDQWSRSAHRFSSFNNPFYAVPFEDMRKRADVGKRPSQWCSGCHDPALMLAGKIMTDVEPRSPEAQAGLTCLACHAIDSIANHTGNGNYNIPDDQPEPYIFGEHKSGPGRVLHDMITKAKPTVHKARMLKPFFRSAEFCATCHKVSLDVPVNKYRWIRGQNDYDAWHDSGVAHNAARTFYLPPKAKVCQDCHMPPEPAVLGDVSAKDGKVRSHRFLSVNTALPAIRGDQDTIKRTEEFLRDEKLRVDIFAFRPVSETSAEAGPDAQDPIFRALNLTHTPLVAGETVEVQVVVRNKGVGHTFPGGTNDSNEGWLEFQAETSDGKKLLHSGAVGQDLNVDPSAHFYHSVVVDRHSQHVARRNAQDIYTPVYVNVIGPGTADLVRYKVRVPEDAGGKSIKLTAKLNWRKFSQKYVEYIFAGKQLPELPITEIETDVVELPVGAARPAEQAAPAPQPDAEWMRFNDHGIGLLLKGDTRQAAATFRELIRMSPKRIDGYRNLARTYMTDGKLDEAFNLLKQCEELKPGDPQTAWVWGNVLKEQGRYPEAAGAFQRVLEYFPDDRNTWGLLGDTYYVDERFTEALDAFGNVLRLDPEDRNSHYHRMLCYRVLKMDDKAKEAETAYLKYQIDESAQEVTKEYRLTDTHAQRESQRIHVHD